MVIFYHFNKQLLCQVFAFFSSCGLSCCCCYANVAFHTKPFAWTDPGRVNAACDIILLDPSKHSHCYLIMRPLFGTTEAVVQSSTGIQACWDRMAQSVFSVFLSLLCSSYSSVSFTFTMWAKCWCEPFPVCLATEVLLLVCCREHVVGHGISIVFKIEIVN